VEPSMISVIIPAKDAAHNIENCLRACQQQANMTVDSEIILVDDGSTDKTAEIGERLGVQVIRQANAGPAAARNAGASAAQGEILAFTDADCIPSSEWLFHLIQPFEDPEIVGAKGTYKTHQTHLVPRFVQQEYGYKYLRLARQDRIDFIDTYSAAYRRDVFIENGGFDSAFAVPSVEDQELSFRLARKGYHMVFAPDAVVYHVHDVNLKEYGQRKFGIGYWKAFMLRWLPEKTFQDSHTPPTLRWQILVLAGLLLSGGISFLWPVGGWLVLFFLVAFLIAAGPFVSHLLRTDSGIWSIILPMLLLRAGALGFGLAYGLVLPPRTQPRTYTGLSPVERFFKRILDIVGGAVGMLIFSPVFIISALAIKLTSPGPVVFSQARSGENGKPFQVKKLRTMFSGSETQVETVLNQNPLEGPVYKIPADPRVTPVGRGIRRWSFDEIPQFWNILRGEMSLVGPRPEETWVVAQYNDDQRRRLVVKPGLTGPMQISGRGELDMAARLALEIDYINNYSFWKDIAIILRTIPAVISGKGAF
jgi:lipopolysaccharide/colanic/teichoic acid biosynthesis glycosyltransferase/glycosyltransferase involved in cell wall biosynthesis